MPTDELDELTDDTLTTNPEDAADAEDSEVDEDENQDLVLEVSIDEPSACERHVTVTISRDDIDRYYDNAYSEMMSNAAVPGFRVGRAPRKLVESRFRKEVGDQIKGSLLIDSLEQISEEQDFSAISEPVLDIDAVEVPDEGPMTFEFDIEVRPEFDIPDWKGLKIEQPTCEFSREDIDYQLEQMLERHGQLVPHEGKATDGDYLVLNITCSHGGKQLTYAEEEVVRLLPALSLRDAKLENFGKLMTEVQAGDTVTTEVTLTQDAQNEELRGQRIEIKFDVLELKKLLLPELTADFVWEIGEFESEGDLRDAIQSDLERQLKYEQQQKTRQQISTKLTEAADWDLPPSMLKRQSARELERMIMELRRSGFSEAEVRARENELRQNSSVATAAALKEHFILERIAEEEKIEASEADYEQEISLMAMQSGETPRRVRAQIEKRDLMDVLRNQIVERKVVGMVEAEAKFVDVPFTLPRQQAIAIDFSAGGESIATEISETTEEEE